MAIDGLQLQSLWIIPTVAVSQHVFGQVELEELVLDGEEAASGAADVEVAGAKAAKVEEEGEEEEEEEEEENEEIPDVGWVQHDRSEALRLVGKSGHAWGLDSHWRDCHFADALSPSLLKHLLKVEGGAAE